MTHEAYCLVCCGGGKTLVVGTKKKAEREATSHMNLYGHTVTMLPTVPKTRHVTTDSCRSNGCRLCD
jgi:hypothetical protein